MASQILINLGIAWAFAALLMFITWLIAIRLNNLGFVDITWSISFLPIALFYAAYNLGFDARSWLIAAMGGLWSLRLGLHVAIRVIKHHPEEDVRYAKFRQQWGTRLKSRAFWFFQIQALSIAALSSVFLLPTLYADPHLVAIEWIGFAVWLIAIAGESVADQQLKSFRANPANRGRVCQAGLWNFSRHPNYFFEWLNWVGFFVFAWHSPGGCYTVFCSALMLYFLLRVTGIPLTEEMSLKSKGDAYRQYQQTTNAFVPWFKKKV